MYLTYRPAQISDIDACFEMLPRHFPCTPAEIQFIANIWRQWLREGTIILGIIEDEESDSSKGKAVAFGSSIFVTDEFYERAISSLCPPLALASAQEAQEGRCPALSLEQVRSTNSGEGLNLLILVIGWRDIKGEDSMSRIRAKLLEAFFYMHAGYKVKRGMQEVYTLAEMERGLASGIDVFSDFSHCRPTPAVPDERIYIMGTTRETVRESSAVWPLFLYSPPRFYFSSAEQDVLKLAILGKTDFEIAGTLCITPAAVHKRWKSILDRAQAAPGVTWIPTSVATSPASPAQRTGRGSEKRSHLLNYLRAHPEELRPVQRPRR